MTEISGNAPRRLPDHATVEAIIAGPPAGTGEIALAKALSAAFPDFAFSATSYDDQYWRDSRSVIGADAHGSPIIDPVRELAKENGDINALCTRLHGRDLQMSE